MKAQPPDKLAGLLQGRSCFFSSDEMKFSLFVGLLRVRAYRYIDVKSYEPQESRVITPGYAEQILIVDFYIRSKEQAGGKGMK